ncbi:uncharacterized protein DS421_5g142720 [Arachis hypogaea]|nr:uncharacterized protein DS421_5g142720 [Arachis hypogaea]
MDASSRAKAIMDVDNSPNPDTGCHLNDEAHEIPDVTTLTQPSMNVGDPLYGELTGSVRALSVAVEALTSKLEVHYPSIEL